jgi:cytoskeletal protein RodZ
MLRRYASLLGVDVDELKCALEPQRGLHEAA